MTEPVVVVDDDLPLFPRQRTGGHAQQDLGAVGPQRAQLLVDPLASEEVAFGPLGDGAGVGMDDLTPRHLEERVRGTAEHRAGCGVHAQVAAVGTEQRHPCRAVLEDGEPLIGEPALVGRPLEM